MSTSSNTHEAVSDRTNPTMKVAGRVSVLIPTYNRAHLIRNAVDSVLAQTYSNLELIVIDDGSTDDTAAVMAEYQAPAHPSKSRVHFLRQENKGKSAALNNGFSKSTGEWIAFLDSDDVWLPEKLEWQFRALQKFPECGACFTDCQFETDDDVTRVKFPFPEASGSALVLGKLPESLRSLAESPCGSIITFVCRADLFNNIGGFDPLLHFTEDYDFVFRLAAVTDFCFVNKPLAIADRCTTSHARHIGSSHVWDRVEFRLTCEQYRFEKWLQMDKGLSSEVRNILTRRLRAVHSSWANWYLGHEDYRKARQAILAATKYEVTLPLLAKWCLISGFPGFMHNLAVKRGIFHDLA